MPVVANNSGTSREILYEIGKDFLFDPEDEMSLANKILKALRDEKMAKESGEKGKKLVEEKYTWKTNGATVDATLEKVL